MDGNPMMTIPVMTSRPCPLLAGLRLDTARTLPVWLRRPILSDALRRRVGT
jgi:hypothetical protein